MTKYTYGTCAFTSESRDQNGCGYCVEMEGWQSAWSGRAIECEKGKAANAKIMENSRVCL